MVKLLKKVESITKERDYSYKETWSGYKKEYYIKWNVKFEDISHIREFSEKPPFDTGDVVKIEVEKQE